MNTKEKKWIDQEPLMSHDLANILLGKPNCEIVINGWGSAEGCGPYVGGYPVTGIRVGRDNGCEVANLELAHNGCLEES